LTGDVHAMRRVRVSRQVEDWTRRNTATKKRSVVVPPSVLYVISHSQITLAADARELPTKRIARACAGIERAVRHDDSEGIMEESLMIVALCRLQLFWSVVYVDVLKS
jgi:hypothetical protein